MRSRPNAGSSSRANAWHALLVLSGFCGVSYEILYARLLGNLFGSQFAINASVLLAFLLGIGVGALMAHRWARWLWAIEAGIGLYAALMAGLYPFLEDFFYSALPGLTSRVLACGLAAVGLLLVPALLIGCSVPLFAGYLARIQGGSVFATTYELYNLGAALTVIAIEFVVLRTFGLAGSTLLLAGLNGLVAVGVFVLTRGIGEIRLVPLERLRFPRNDLGGLAIVGVASAVFQLLMIKLSEFLLGPYNETLALVLAVVLVGLTLGSVVVSRTQLTFRGALLLALFGLLSLISMFPGVGWLYARGYATAVQSYPLLVVVKLGAVFLLMGVASTGFGAMIPALLKTHRDIARESGELLFVSALANSLGFFLMAFVLHRHFDYGSLILWVGALIGLGLLVSGGIKRAVSWVGLALVAALAVSVGRFWDEELLFIGHTNFHSVEELEEERESRIYSERFKGPQDVFAITWKDDEPYFFINGYISIPLRSNAEKLVGALGTMYSPRTDRALVLGLGSGATAGTVGLFFDRTDVVEINRVVVENIDRMAEYNFDIRSNASVSLLVDDALHFVRTAGDRYSLILNTVTTPLYFSSSKLYTRDFLEAARNRLTPDGVYLTWLDSRVGDRGFEIIMQTLAEVFERCWLNYMSSDYFVLACSQGPVAPHQLAAVLEHPQLEESLATELAVPLSMLPYHVVSTDVLRLAEERKAPVNVLDFPVLEFEMAQLRPGGFVDVWRRLEGTLDLTAVEAAFAPYFDWRPSRFAVYRDLRTGRRAELNRVLVEATEDLGEGDGYEKAALGAAAEVASAKAYFRVGQRLLGREYFAAAVRAFSEAGRLDLDSEDLDHYLGRSYLGLGENDAALSAFTSHWSQEREARSAVGRCRALLALERPREALASLDSETGAPDLGESVRERADIAYCRGRAYSALGRNRRARIQMAKVLSLRPSDPRALAALSELNSKAEGGQGEVGTVGEVVGGKGRAEHSQHHEDAESGGHSQ